jgi:predicted Zn-dependent peptidase
VHAGSVDERPDQQGLAHVVEHVTFLGSRRREGLLGTGARSNAYTDFHHTVFHVHAPLANGALPGAPPMLPQVLASLAEIAFDPELLPSRLEKERAAVLAEAQMMNTIEYRVDCQLLKFLHAENALGARFPIGRADQVRGWQRDALLEFWADWYFPANATLYLVGDLGLDTADAAAAVEAAFGGVPAGRQAGPGDTPAVAAYERALAAAGGSPATARLPSAADLVASYTGPPKERHPVRPPVTHVYGCGQETGSAAGGPGGTAAVDVFRHRLLQQFMLSIFCKLPVRPVVGLDDVKHAFVVRLLLSVWQFRIGRRYVAADPPFVDIALDISDSAREGCAVSTLTVTAEPGDWRGAVQVAIQEVRRLQTYGVTPGELDRYRTALLRDSEQAAEQAASFSSDNNLNFVMESLALSHTVQHQSQAHAATLAVADSVSLEDVNAAAASLLSFASHYGEEAGERAAAAGVAMPSAWAPPGPTRATSIVACIPAFADPSGLSTGGAAPMVRGASLATDMHVSGGGSAQPIVPVVPAGEEVEAGASSDVDEGDPPPGAVRFDVSAADIEAALAAASEVEVEAPEDIDVPDSLVPAERVAELLAAARPAFVPVAGREADGPLPPTDPDTGITQRRLSNGLRINYCATDNEPRAAMLRVVAPGGRSREGGGAGSPGGGPGSVAVGTRALSEVGTVGAWRRDQVELFCIARLITSQLECDEEFVFMDAHFAVGDGGLKAVLEMVHLLLAEPAWEEGAADRARQVYASHARSLDKSLERATSDRVVSAMLGGDRRFVDASPEEVNALTLGGMRAAVGAQLAPQHVEVNLVGDFDPADVDDLVLAYLGTLAPGAAAGTPPGGAGAGDESPVAVVRGAPPASLRQAWHLHDSDERAIAYIAGSAPCRWGAFSGAGSEPGPPPPPPARPVPPPPTPPATASADDLAAARAARRAHPLFADVSLSLLAEVVNSRLFTTVRDALGLTYDVSFELSLFDRLRAGWFCIKVTSTPQRIRDAADASLRVLRSLKDSRVTPRELLRAKRTLLARHETDLKDNAYRLGLLTHLQCEGVPLKVPEAVRDLRRMYEAATVDDVHEAYAQLALGDGDVFVCVGTSGPEEPAEATVTPVSAAAVAAAAAPSGGGGGGTPFAGADAKSRELLAAIAAGLQTKQIAEAVKAMAARMPQGGGGGGGGGKGGK